MNDEEEPYRVGLAAALVAGSMAVSVGAAWVASRPAPVIPPAAATAVSYTGLLFAAFVAAVMAAVLDYHRWDEPVEDVPRPVVSAMLLVATAAVLAILALRDALIAWLIGVDPVRYGVALALGLAAGASAVAVDPDRWPRHTVTLGGLLAIAGAVAIDGPIETITVLAFASATLVHAWTRESTAADREYERPPIDEQVAAAWRELRTLDVPMALLATWLGAAIGAAVGVGLLRWFPGAGLGAFVGSAVYLYYRSSPRRAVGTGLYLFAFGLLLPPVTVVFPALAFGDTTGLPAGITPTILLAGGGASLLAAGAAAVLGAVVQRGAGTDGDGASATVRGG